MLTADGLIAAEAASPAHRALLFAVVMFAFGGVTALMGSRRLKPPGGGRYAQARGSWEAGRWLRWVFIALGVAALVAAAALAI